jgi:hypothetical protein
MGPGRRAAPTADASTAEAATAEPTPVPAAAHDAVLCARGAGANTATGRWAAFSGFLEAAPARWLRKSPNSAENSVDQALAWFAGLDK